MDIFDAVTIWLEQKKDSGSTQIYLNQASKEQLSRFLELSRDDNKLETWLAENGQTVHTETQAQTEKSIPEQVPIQSTTAVVEETLSPVIEKLGPKKTEIMANEPQIVPPLPELSIEPPQTVVPTTDKLLEKEQNLEEMVDPSDYLFLNEISNQTTILIIGEQLYQPQLTEPFAKSKSLLQEMIKAMDNFSKKTVEQEIALSWENISLLEVCKKEFNEYDNIAYIKEQLTQAIKTVNPKVVLLMGALPTKALTGTEHSILNIHGQWFNFQNVPCMPTFHPDFLSRAVSRKKEAWADLKNIIKLLSDRRI